MKLHCAVTSKALQLKLINYTLEGRNTASDLKHIIGSLPVYTTNYLRMDKAIHPPYQQVPRICIYPFFSPLDQVRVLVNDRSIS